MTNPSPRSFSEIGLPEGHAFPELSYHAPTGFLVAHTRPLDSALPSRRLSARRVTEPRYRPVGDFPPAISVESYAASFSLPVLYFLTYEWSEYPNGPVGGHWDALYRFNLETRQSEVVARRGEVIPPNRYKSAWLSALFSVGADGCTIFCKAALEGAEVTDYCLSEFLIAERKLTPINMLEAVFA